MVSPAGGGSSLPSLGGALGRQVPLHQVGDDTAAQKQFRRRTRIFSYRYAHDHDKDSITSAQPPPSIPWSEWPSRIGTKIKNAFTVSIEWLQKIVVGAVNVVVRFFSSPFKSSPEAIRAADIRALSRGRTTPEDLIKMLKSLKKPKDEENKRYWEAVLIANLKRLESTGKPTDQTLLQTIYAAVGKLIQKKEQPQPDPTTTTTTTTQDTPEAEKKKETWGHWFGRGSHAVSRGARYVGSGFSHAVGAMVDYTPVERGENYLKPNGSDFSPERVLEHAELIRDILLEQKK